MRSSLDLQSRECMTDVALVILVVALTKTAIETLGGTCPPSLHAIGESLGTARWPLGEKANPMQHELLSGQVLLFQYGSNMSEQRLGAKIREHSTYAPPSAQLDLQLLGAACLRHWQFALDLYSAKQECLVADIVEGEDDDEVWGALYRLDRELVVRSDRSRSVLDRIEGHRTEVDPENYHPITVTVWLNGEPRDAHTYVGGEDARRRCSVEHPEALPHPDYSRAILKGARSVGLPSDYIQALIAEIESRRPAGE